MYVQGSICNVEQIGQTPAAFVEDLMLQELFDYPESLPSQKVSKAFTPTYWSLSGDTSESDTKCMLSELAVIFALGLS